MVLAQEEARLLNHNYIGTEHILLGMIAEHEGVAGVALESLGVDLDRARTIIKEIIGTGPGESPAGHLPFTPRAKKVLELSLREALQLGHNYIGTEHILLGMIREGEGVAAQVLHDRFGLDLSTVRQKIIQILSGYVHGKHEGIVGAAFVDGIREGIRPSHVRVELPQSLERWMVQLQAIEAILSSLSSAEQAKIVAVLRVTYT